MSSDYVEYVGDKLATMTAARNAKALPYYIRAEANAEIDDDYQGAHSPLSVT